ncbi:hypothetical protein, partial [Bacillus pseudomycoides]|uniref:hypothetical protein n=1 Tax=Bacillus pseudomycoides TaxID=64104 RepID=UPI002FFE42B6
ADLAFNSYNKVIHQYARSVIPQSGTLLNNSLKENWLSFLHVRRDCEKNHLKRKNTSRNILMEMC